MSLSRRLFNGFDDFFAPPTFPDFGPVPFLTDNNRDSDMVLRRSSPCYEVTENDNQYQLSVDVPGVKLDDINIELEHDRVLHISGGRKIDKTDEDGAVFKSETKFEKRFVLDQTIDASKVTGNLENGVLTVTAPKDPERKTVKKIAITNGIPNKAIEENPQDAKMKE